MSRKLYKSACTGAGFRELPEGGGENEEGIFTWECSVINLGYEYPGYTGKEKYAVITDLTETELRIRYGSVIDRYEPFLILTKETGRAIYEYRSNENKYRLRARREVSLSALNENLMAGSENSPAEEEEKKWERDEVIELIRSLPFNMADKIIRYYFDSLTMEEIAREEGISVQAVSGTISRALKRMKRLGFREAGKEACG